LPCAPEPFYIELIFFFTWSSWKPYSHHCYFLLFSYYWTWYSRCCL